MNFKVRCPTSIHPGHVLTWSLAASYETTLIQLTNAEIQVEDLKMQLDDALGAEEMLVKLTERNLELGEVGICVVTLFEGWWAEWKCRKSKTCASLSRILRL